MSPEILFKIVNGIAFFGWLLMIALPKWKITKAVIKSDSVIIIFAVIYAIILFSNIGKVDFEDFGSLNGIIKIFKTSDAWGISAIWYHILAFDFFVGSWIYIDAQKVKINHLFVIPCLLFTFMLGPLGFLIYKTVKYFSWKYDNKIRS